MTTNEMNKVRPWASFCLATYRRPELLEKTLKNIQEQTMPDFEVIVSDNDPDGSSRIVVESLQDSRFRYFCNSENLGMVKNFNKALERAEGEFVVMITDDDPPYADMLETLRSLSESYPGYGMYYGTYEAIFSESMAKLYKVTPGKISVEKVSGLTNYTPGEISEFAPDDFRIKFWRGKVFPVFLWSTGVIRRDIALEIGGLPDYGSPHLSDYIYMFLAGFNSGCVTINKPLGCQTLHGKNYSYKDVKELKTAAQGCYEFVYNKMYNNPNWYEIKNDLENFLGRKWLISYALLLKENFKSDPESSKKLKKVLGEIFKLSYMRKFRIEYSYHAYTPLIIKKTYMFLKRHITKHRFV